MTIHIKLNNLKLYASTIYFKNEATSLETAAKKNFGKEQEQKIDTSLQNVKPSTFKIFARCLAASKRITLLRTAGMVSMPLIDTKVKKDPPIENTQERQDQGSSTQTATSFFKSLPTKIIRCLKCSRLISTCPEEQFREL